MIEQNKTNKEKLKKIVEEYFITQLLEQVDHQRIKSGLSIAIGNAFQINVDVKIESNENQNELIGSCTSKSGLLFNFSIVNGTISVEL
jgi:hypothetical protein